MLFEEGSFKLVKHLTIQRFEKRIYIPLPNESARLKMLSNSVKDESVDHSITQEEWNQIVKKTEGFVCNISYKN